MTDVFERKGAKTDMRAYARLGDEPARRAWADFAQMLLASNAFLYVE